MMLVQPSGVSIHLGLTYEGDFENGMRHGRGTLTLRPFTPTPATENFSPITIYEGEWQHDLMHGRGKYCCLPMYESRSDCHNGTMPRPPAVPEIDNQLLTRGTVTKKCFRNPIHPSEYDCIYITRQWHNFGGAKVKGGVLECAFEKGKLVGQGKCTFYGSEYGRDSILTFSIGNVLRKRKDYRWDEMYVVSFEGDIKWGRHGRHFDLHRLTWADYDDCAVGPECGLENYVLTLGNGERWEGKLKIGYEGSYNSAHHCSGPWTRTNKNGIIEEVIKFSEKWSREVSWSVLLRKASR